MIHSTRSPSVLDPRTTDLLFSSQVTTTVLFTDRWFFSMSTRLESLMMGMVLDTSGDAACSEAHNVQHNTYTVAYYHDGTLHYHAYGCLKASSANLTDTCIGPPPDGNLTLRPASHECVTVIRFSVSVPVLSLQMSVALPMVSQAASTRIKFWSFSILRVEYASVIVTASGCETTGHHNHRD